MYSPKAVFTAADSQDSQNLSANLPRIIWQLATRNWQLTSKYCSGRPIPNRRNTFVVALNAFARNHVSQSQSPQISQTVLLPPRTRGGLGWGNFWQLATRNWQLQTMNDEQLHNDSANFPHSRRQMTIPTTRRQAESFALHPTARPVSTADNDICDMPASLVPADNPYGNCVQIESR